MVAGGAVEMHADSHYDVAKGSEACDAAQSPTPTTFIALTATTAERGDASLQFDRRHIDRNTSSTGISGAVLNCGGRRIGQGSWVICGRAIHHRRKSFRAVLHPPITPRKWRTTSRMPAQLSHVATMPANGGYLTRASPT